jgi:DNA-directed RNA polymerase subunit RPC12/RpoP
MISFTCPTCGQPIAAIQGRTYTTCESCGHRTEVPEVAEAETLTLEDLKALRQPADG